MEDESYMNMINMSVKDHIVKLELKIAEVKDNLEGNKKAKNECRLQLISYGDLHNQQRADLQDYINQQSKRIQMEFEKQVKTDSDDSKFHKQQINQIFNDKINLQQKSLVLENQIVENEKVLGYKYIYDNLRQQNIRVDL